MTAHSTPAGDPNVVIIGGDALALSTAREISQLQGCPVTVLWHADREFAAMVEAVGARYVAGRPESRDGLVAAGVEKAASILALSPDDQLNLQAALRARDANPNIRIVLRQFNRALAAKIEQNLADCSVLSLAWHSAATYAAAALDPSCFRGLQFPEPDGPLTGFARRIADRDHIAGQSIADAEKALGARIVAVGGNTDLGPDDPIPPGSRLVVYGALDRLLASTPRQMAPHRHLPLFERTRGAVRRWRRRLRRVDPYIAAFASAALALFAVASWHFRTAFGSDWLTAAYFVLTTMTTTGYGDITPNHEDPVDVILAMVLMFLGTVFTGTFIAFVASRLTRAQWVRMQGLRPIRRHGHIVVCGCGSIGSGVVDLLLGFDKPIVVVEEQPHPSLVERARDRGFDLLTGDASSDETLGLCNLAAAHSLVALTNIDTLNLEIALGARVRNPTMPIVLRIAEASFAASIARHFELETTFSVAALAGPVFAAWSRTPGARGRIAFDGREYTIAESDIGEHGPVGAGDNAVMPGNRAIPLAAAMPDGEFALLRDFAEAPRASRALMLVPVPPFDAGHGTASALAGTMPDSAEAANAAAPTGLH